MLEMSLRPPVADLRWLEYVLMASPPARTDTVPIIPGQPWTLPWRSTSDHPISDRDERRLRNIFCPACISIFSTSSLIHGAATDLVPVEERYTLHDTVADFRYAVDQGCHFCNIAWDRMTQRGLAMLSVTSRARIGLTVFWGEIFDRVHVGLSLNGFEPGFISHDAPTPSLCALEPPYQVYSWVFWPTSLQGVRTVWDRSTEYCFTGSSQHLKLAKSWLDGCLEKHICCRVSSENFLPTRLLHVGTDSSSPCLSEDHHELGAGMPAYCTLSHCWGGAEDIIKLRTTNIDQLKIEIPMDDLPQTFRDAVLVARSLDVAYLWIDSICIIQDSKADWEKEAAMMGKVYENSTLTITASNARNPHDGCFSIVNPLVINPCIVVDPDTTSLYGAAGDETVGRRGWILQERYLSPRLLYFGPSGIAWRCEAGSANQQDPRGQGILSRATKTERASAQVLFGAAVPERTQRAIKSDSEVSRIRFRDILNLGSETPPRRDKDFLDKFTDSWTSTIEEYSKCRTSYQSDKLVAIAGLAERVQTRTGLTYIPAAGMWEEVLLEKLCWFVQVDSSAAERRPRPGTNSRLPTWSWAATNDNIGAFLHRTIGERWIPMASGLKVSTTTSTHESGSDTPKTSIRLIAKLEPVHLNPSAVYERHLSTSLVHGVFTIQDSPWPGVRVFVFMDILLDQRLHSRAYLTPLIFYNEVDYPGVVMHVCSDWAFGLVLVLVESSMGGDEFERVGCFGVERWEDGDGFKRWFEDLPAREIVIV